MKRYKCIKCFVIWSTDNKQVCPICKDDYYVSEVCELDRFGCPHDIVSGLAYCPKCGEAVCPICGAHDVMQVSRITGYLQSVEGFNNGKRQELKDRTRYNTDGTIHKYYKENLK